MPLTYGEVTFDSLREIFDRIYAHKALPRASLQTKQRFYDLGHGGGRACFAAACLHPFQEVTGIEVRDEWLAEMK